MKTFETKSDQQTNSLLPNTSKQNKKLCTKKCTLLLIVLGIIVIICVLIITDAIPNILADKSNSNKAGTFGKWSSYGGSSKNQQFAPIESNAIINQQNIKNVSLQCTHSTNAMDGGYSGFITIDDDDNGYITIEGKVYKFDLHICQEIWSVNIAELLGYDPSSILMMRHTGTLFSNSNQVKGILFGAPNYLRVGISYFEPCWAIALDINNGSLLWKTNLGQGIENYGCRLHGFMVDANDHFAYGGMAVPSRRNNSDAQRPFVAVPRGKMFKLDIDNGEIVNVWHSIDNYTFGFDANYVNVSDPYIYRGASLWNMPAIIADYLVFGTGNINTYPKYVENCLLQNETYDSFESAPIDPCGNNRSNEEKFWRCLEKGVYPSSFIILNKHTFDVEAAVPLQGIDVHDYPCRAGHINGCMRVQAFDADLAAVATYEHDGKYYALAAPKSGHLFLFQVPSGKLVFAKRVGLWSFGGGNQWSIAVDEQHLIAIATITGGVPDYEIADVGNQRYKTILADATEICYRTGSAHAINLNNADTIWQMMNGWGVINNCSNRIFDDYVDITVSCQSQHINDPSETVENVIRPPIDESERDEIVSLNLGKLVAPVTIVNDMVFIPSYSGDIFIHNLFDGQYIHTLQCPNRTEIKGGVTVFEDRVIFFCGSNLLVSMKL